MADNVDEKILIAAHKHSFLNKEEILKSDVCGCFSCLRIFKPSEIAIWQYENETSSGLTGHTAFCPDCFDTVIGSASGYPITTEFLKAMQKRWGHTTEKNESGEVDVIEAASFSELYEIYKKKKL